MASSFSFQFTIANPLLEIQPLVVRKSLACVSPMWFLTTCESKPEILRGPNMQLQPSPGKMLTGFQLLATDKTRICFDIS